MAQPTVQHSKLNTTFQGIRHSISSTENEIWQFRGIKYADIPGRFRQSTLHETFPPVYNATEYGPKCPQTIFPLRIEDSLIGLPPNTASHAPDIFDELNCLSLNITMPAGAHAGDDLPVMVYVHGGGGFSGANSDWWCDGGSIVKRSLEIGKPIIMVAINYRLTVFGYIGADELGDVNGKQNIANFGPRDLHTAMSWIHSHIGPFGGSPSKITIYGESHGSVEIGIQLHANSSFSPLFTRAIMQSQNIGSPLFTSPIPLSDSNAIYSATKAALNVTSAKELETVPWETLLAAFQKSDPRNGVGHSPTIDRVFFPEAWKDNLKANFAGHELLLGSTGNESSALKMILSGLPATDPRPATATLITALSSILPEAKLQSVLEVYGFNEKTEGEVVAEHLLDIIEDIAWYRDQELLSSRAKKAGVKVQEYTFDQYQPFTGPFKGVRGHSLDLAYLHGDPSIFSGCQNPQNEREMQQKLQDSWIRFANGDKEWTGDEARVFGPQAVVRDISKEKFHKELKRSEKWIVWDSVDHESLGGVIAVTVGHVAGLIGTG